MVKRSSEPPENLSGDSRIGNSGKWQHTAMATHCRKGESCRLRNSWSHHYWPPKSSTLVERTVVDIPGGELMANTYLTPPYRISRRSLFTHQHLLTILDPSWNRIHRRANSLEYPVTLEDLSTIQSHPING